MGSIVESAYQQSNAALVTQVKEWLRYQPGREDWGTPYNIPQDSDVSVCLGVRFEALTENIREICLSLAGGKDWHLEARSPGKARYWVELEPNIRKMVGSTTWYEIAHKQPDIVLYLVMD